MPYISATAEIMYTPLDLRLVKGSLAALGISPAGSRSAHARKPAQHVGSLGFSFSHGFPCYARDFASGLPLRSRPQPAQHVCAFGFAFSHRSESITKERGHGFGGIARISLRIRVNPCQSVARVCYAAASGFPVAAVQPIGLSA